eukprot:TRINITY_DN32810_c0_g1_i1.p1 TRINITY_DN32810_c0_g1~~TRINITY_DN32810_c0_g1_i1.p1  ORF type:complete len:922 (-),score=144.52 TRINITY_DN32810_c0_g1_i1:88-2799(-)
MAELTQQRRTAKDRWEQLRNEFGPKKSLSCRLGDVALQELDKLRKLRAERVGGTSMFQSINYTVVDNAACRHLVKCRSEKDVQGEKQKEFLLIMLVGLCAGLTTVVLMWGIDFIHTARTKFFMGLWQQSVAASWLALVVPNACLFMASSCVVLYWKPPAAGSGIPEVKAYLNGILLTHAWGPQVFVAKLLSCLLSCSAGLPIGPEGPIIYLGGNTGMFLTSPPVLRCLGLRYTNSLQRTAITLGVAAGVGAAFSAPIGAVLFVIEEVSSFFTANLIWLGFLCSLTSYFVTILLDRDLMSGAHAFSTLGIFSVQGAKQWQPKEIPCFLLLGLLLGLLGALWNVVNVKLVNSVWRKRCVRVSKRREVAEVACISILVSSLWFFLPAFVTCASKEKSFPSEADSALREATKGLWCGDPQNEYNPLATLMFGSLDETVKYLFTSSFGMQEQFSGPVLFLYSVLFFMFACLLAGSAMATGVFIPMIIIGAGMGCSYAHLLNMLMPGFVPGDSAAYAVVGAAGFVSGVSRISVAMTVIMIEVSTDLGLLLPIMLTVGMAKFTGDYLSHPFFEMILHMKHIPFLEPEQGLAFRQLRCYQVMQRPVVCLPVQVQVMDVLKILCECHHNGFPVVESQERKVMQGVITRAHLEHILKNLSSFLEDEPGLADRPVAADLMNHFLATHKGLSGQEDLAIFDSIETSQLTEVLDLHRWMSRAPVTVHQVNSLEQAVHAFKLHGLRQLFVTNSDNILVGVITRHELYHVQHDPHHYHQHAVQEHDDFARIRRSSPSSSSFSSLMSPTSPAGALQGFPGIAPRPQRVTNEDVGGCGKAKTVTWKDECHCQESHSPAEPPVLQRVTSDDGRQNMKDSRSSEQPPVLLRVTSDDEWRRMQDSSSRAFREGREPFLTPLKE